MNIKKFRKFLAGISVAALLSTLVVVPTAQAANYWDAAFAGLNVQGEPGTQINRCEGAVLVLRAMGEDQAVPSPYPFSDVPDWCKGYVGALYTLGVVQGEKPGVFGANGKLNRGAAAVMFAKAFGLTEMATLTAAQEAEFATIAWAKDAFAKNMAATLIQGKGTGKLDPAGPNLRSEAATIAWRGVEAGLGAGPAPEPEPEPEPAPAPGEPATSEAVTQSFTVGEAAAVSVGGASHTVTVSAATAEEVTLTIESDPVNLTVAAGGSQDIDTDGNGYDDLRVTYNGLDADGNPELVFTPIAEPVITETPVVTTETLTDDSNGSLSIAVSSKTPGAQSVPDQASSVPFAAWDLSATGGDVTVAGVVLKRQGVGAATNYSGLYLFDDSGLRLTSKQSVTSDSNEVTFNNLAVIVKAGTVKTLWLKADIADVTGQTEGNFGILSADKVTVATGDTVSSGGLPAVGATLTILNQAAGTITVTKTGTLSNPKVGDKTAEVAKFQLQASTEEAKITKLSLTLKGTINTTSITNFQLRENSSSGKVLATTAGIGAKDLVTFMFDPAYVLKDGDTKNFSVVADITGQASDTILVWAKEDTDLVSIGGTFGYGMGVTRAAYDGGTVVGTEESGGACAATADDCSRTSLQGGDLTIEFNGPTAATVPIDTQDVIFMDFAFFAQNTTKVTSLAVFAKAKDSGTLGTGNDDGVIDTDGLINNAATTHEANLKDIKIVVKNEDGTSGSTKWGPKELTDITEDAVANNDDNNQTVTFDDDVTITGGTRLHLYLTADVDNNAATAEDYRFEIDVSALTAEDANGDAVAAANIVPSSDVIGNTFTSAQSTLDISLAATPVSQNFVKGETGVELVCGIFRAGTADNVKVSQLVMRFYGDDDSGTDFLNGEGDTAATNIMQSASLYVDGQKVEGPKSLTLVGTIGTDGGYYKATFDNDFTVQKGASSKVCGKVDLSSSITATRYLAGDITPANDITAESAKGTSLAAAQITGGALNNNGTTTPPGPVMTINTSGTLNIAVASDTPKEDIAVMGSTDVVVSKIKFTSTREAFVVEKLDIQNKYVTTVGDYNDNITQLKLSYTDKDGNAITKTGSLGQGAEAATFTGLGIYVPKDGNATISVSASFNTQTGGADAGDLVEISVAFSNFEAVAQGSGERFKGSQADADDLDLGIGTVTYTEPTNTLELASAQDLSASASLGGSSTVTVDNAGADPADRPVGTIVCIDDGDGGTCATEDIGVVTAWGAGTAANDSLTIYWVDDGGDFNWADASDLMYSMPATGYLSAVNSFYVYESKPTVTIATDSPSGNKSITSGDTILKFTVAAAAQEQLQWRAGTSLETSAANSGCVAGTGAPTIDAAEATVVVESASTSCQLDSVTEAGDNVYWDATATANLQNYGRIAFWMRWAEADDDGDALFSDYKVHTGESGFVDGTVNTDTLSQTECNGNATTLATGVWYYCDIAMPAGTAAADRYVLFELDAENAARHESPDDDYVDEPILYYERFLFDIASDASLANTDATPEAISLKEAGNTVANGYVDYKNASSAMVTLVPTATQGTLEIGKGTSKTFTLEVDTNDLLTDQAGTDDQLSLSFDYGTSGTAGDWRWYETNATATWFGNVGATKFNGNSLKY